MPRKGKKAAKKVVAENVSSDANESNSMEGDTSKNGEKTEEELQEVSTARTAKRAVAKDDPKVGGKKTKRTKKDEEEEKNGETVDEEQEEEPIAGSAKRTATAKDEQKVGGRKGKRTKKAEEDEKNGETADEEPVAKPTKRAAAKSEPKVRGKKAKRTKKGEEEEKKVKEEDEEIVSAAEDGPEEDQNEESDSTTTKKNSPMKKVLRGRTVQENGAITKLSLRSKSSLTKPTETKTSKRRPGAKKVASRSNEQGRKQYEVEQIVNVRKKSGKRQFLVKWKGYGPKQNTWEPENNLNCPQLLSAFLKKEGKTA